MQQVSRQRLIDVAGVRCRVTRRRADRRVRMKFSARAAVLSMQAFTRTD